VSDANTEMEQIQTNNPQVNLDTYNPENDQSLVKLAADENVTKSADASNTTDPTKPPAEETFWEKNKKWIKPTAWVTGILAALGIGYKVYTSNQKKTEKKKESGVSGVPKRNTKSDHRKK